MSSLPSSTRRDFITAASLGGAAAILPGHAVATPASDSPSRWRRGRIIPADGKLNVACVGCGGKGVSDVASASGENIVALCDVDPAQAQQVFAKYPAVPKYKDYRRMLLELDEQIDAVVISTPDHTHHPIAMLAIALGKHVFVQKPMAHSVREAREMLWAAQQRGVITQMGNQGHASEGIRLAQEWLEAGLIGDVTEVHVWTSKLEPGPYKAVPTERVPAGEKEPETLDWPLWLGPVDYRPFSAEYHPRKWRSWWRFGGGALGDIGCHTMDAPVHGLNLGAPAWIQAECAPFTDETFPDWSIVTYQFPARGSQPSVKMVWYDGGKLPPLPPGFEAGRTLSARSGYYMVGSKGVIYDPTEKSGSPRLVPESRMRDSVFPPKTIPRIPGGDPVVEWILACKGGPKPGSSFEYAAKLTEIVALGTVAIRARGKRLEWDATKGAFPNAPECNPFLL
jgi:predicted dehydrogenase